MVLLSLRVHIDTGLTSDWMNQMNYFYNNEEEVIIRRKNSTSLIDAMTD